MEEKAKSKYTDLEQDTDVVGRSSEDVRQSAQSTFESATHAVSMSAAKRGSLFGSVAIPSPAELAYAEETTPKELKAWYLFDAANGAFFYGVLNFLPVLILNQAKESGINNYCSSLPLGTNLTDCATGTWHNGKGGAAEDYYYKGTCTGILNTGETFNYTSCKARNGTWDPTLKSAAATVDLFGMFSVNYTSVYSTASLISVVLQLILFVTLSAMADYGDKRKQTLMISTWICGACCLPVVLATSAELYHFNCLMIILGNLMMGFAVIFYNAYLPLLVQNSPSVLAVLKDDNSTEQEKVMAIQQTTNQVSARGFSTGFVGQFVYLLVAGGIIFAMAGDENLAMGVACFVAGLWILLLSAYTFKHVKTRPGHALPEGQSYIAVSVRTTVKTFKTYKQLPELFKFLGAYFIFSDGVSTIASSAATFAAAELGLASAPILLGILEVSVMAVVGCIICFKLEAKYNISPKVLLLCSLVVLGLLPIYATYLLFSPWEFYLLAFLFGLATGPQQAYTRGLFSSCVPQGHEAEYFGFYEVTDKGTAWAGPLCITVISTATGSFRKAFGILSAFVFVGSSILFFFDVDRAREQKEKFEEAHKSVSKASHPDSEASAGLTSSKDVSAGSAGQSNGSNEAQASVEGDGVEYLE